MDLVLDKSLAARYHSAAQRARVMTEGWFSSQMYCPRCGANYKVAHLPNNSPVADFVCPNCGSEYELKSKSGKWSHQINNGAYGTLVQRITSNTNPDWFFLSYSLEMLSVQQLVMIPRHFFTPSIVMRRKPLASTARRAGWVGSTISLDDVPLQGRIQIVRDGVEVDPLAVQSDLKKADALAVGKLDARGWLLDVLQCVNAIDDKEFVLADVYAYEELLSKKHPDNNNVRPKIRQQLQMLRDRGVIEFLGHGRYRKLG